MKRLFCLLICLCMMMPLLALLPFEAAATETEAKLSVSNGDGETVTNEDGEEILVFEYGEPIMVTPLVGSGNDEIAIAPTDNISGGAMRYKRIVKDSQDGTRVASKGMGVNVAVDIRTGAIAGGRDAKADIASGYWTVIWIPNGGAAGTYTDSVEIYVRPGPMTTDKLEYRVGEPINVTAKMAGENTLSWYGIVPDEGGAPKRSFGAMIYYHLYEGLGTGETSNTQNIRAYADEEGNLNTGFHTFGDTARANCAAYMGVAERGLLSLPAGTYWILYCSDSDSVWGMTHMIQIKIKPCIELEKTTFATGEAINVTAYGRTTSDEIIIVPKPETLESDLKSSIRWKQFTSGTEFNMREGKATTYYPELVELPAGEYSLFIIYYDENGAGNMKAWNANYATRVDITISGTKPAAPSGVSYTLDSTTNGLAAGDITVTFTQAMLDDKNAAPTHVILYWGDANGKLADQTYITVRRVAGTTVAVDLSSVTMIPASATRLMAYAYNACGASDGFACAELPDHTDTFVRGDLITSFQIVSDVHSGTGSNGHIKNFFADVKAVDPNSAGIFVSGDITNNGTETEYNNLYALWSEYFGENSDVHIPFFAATGNHEYKPYGGDDVFDAKTALFIENVNKYLAAAGQETVDRHYYDLWIDGFHFIFLGGGYAGTNAYLSNEQLAWLDATLAEDRNAGRPSFVMLHQCLYNTVAGGMPGQTWNGVIAGTENWEKWKALKASGGHVNDRDMLDTYEAPLRDILRKYPEAMMFSGHSHWDMTSPNNMYDPKNVTDSDNALPNYLFNTGAVAYLASGVRYDDGEDLPYNSYGGQGYYVYIYKNCIEFRARNYLDQKWIPNATYRIAFANAVEPHVCSGAFECSDECSVCGAAITPAKSHEGANTCTNICKYCEQAVVTPTTTHKGAKECSDTCKHCQASITPAKSHEGEHPCVNICKYCAQAVVTSTAQHVGQHACSATCKVCGAHITAGDHVYGAWQQHSATQHKKACACGDTVYADHTWNNGEVTIAPTTGAEGEKTFTCTACNATKTESVERLPASPVPDENTGNNEAVNDGSTDSNAAGNSGQTDVAAEEGLPAGAIVGIVIGAVILLGGGGFALYWFVLRKKK